jgi:hypothetical protein
MRIGIVAAHAGFAWKKQGTQAISGKEVPLSSRSSGADENIPLGQVCVHGMDC